MYHVCTYHVQIYFKVLGCSDYMTLYNKQIKSVYLSWFGDYVCQITVGRYLLNLDVVRLCQNDVFGLYASFVCIESG